MRRFLASLTIIVLLGAAPPPTHTEAPLDESFGPFKYTALSVRTKIGFLGRSYDARWADDASLLHDAALVESSYDVWRRRYPRDPWLAPTELHLAELYFKIQTPEARAKAKRRFADVATSWPNTREGRAARTRLQQGFPALHAETAVQPTPAPYAESPTPAPASSAMPSALASPQASASPAPSPTPKH